MPRILVATLVTISLWLGVVSVSLAQGDQTYRLGAGDRLKITVYQEEDLSGEFEVSDTGEVSMPLIGGVDAAGRSIQELQDSIEAAFLDGYLRNPRVSVEVMNYRPFYVIGEVNEPGSYPYRSGLDVLTAVAMGGGFTFRADEDDIIIKRASDPENEIRARSTTKVLPGDVIRVDERLF
ncbi:MAG: polysaccharide biosynthesis/export family protein [Minwuia sp.]|uniref:polysaccharide biosynthesis/export family protein n=1 Tax=Minwuia sp. TaxID=2493630 RepID=UPI003A87E04A